MRLGVYPFCPSRDFCNCTRAPVAPWGPNVILVPSRHLQVRFLPRSLGLSHGCRLPVKPGQMVPSAHITFCWLPVWRWGHHTRHSLAKCPHSFRSCNQWKLKKRSKFVIVNSQIKLLFASTAHVTRLMFETNASSCYRLYIKLSGSYWLHWKPQIGPSHALIFRPVENNSTN